MNANVFTFPLDAAQRARLRTILSQGNYLPRTVPYAEAVAEAPSWKCPETAEGIDDRFAFVNLDMDLYEPTIEGLRFFYPRMSEGGVILIHDYFSEAYPNIEQSVDDFVRELGTRLRKIPIGDDISMAIVK